MPKKTKGGQEENIDSSGTGLPAEQDIVYHVHCKRCGAVQEIDLEEFEETQPYKYHCHNCNFDTVPWTISSLLFDLTAAFGGYTEESVAEDLITKCQKFNKPSNITYSKVGEFLEYCCEKMEGTMDPDKLTQIRALIRDNMGYAMRTTLFEVQLVLHTHEAALEEEAPWFYAV